MMAYGAFVWPGKTIEGELVGDPKHHRSLFPKKDLWPLFDELEPIDGPGRFIGKTFRIITCANEGWYTSSYQLSYQDLLINRNNPQALNELLKAQRQIALTTLGPIIERERWLTPFRRVWNRLPDWLYYFLHGIKNRWNRWRYRNLPAYDEDEDESD